LLSHVRDDRVTNPFDLCADRSLEIYSGSEMRLIRHHMSQCSLSWVAPRTSVAAQSAKVVSESVTRRPEGLRWDDQNRRASGFPSESADGSATSSALSGPGRLFAATHSACLSSRERGIGRAAVRASPATHLNGLDETGRFRAVPVASEPFPQLAHRSIQPQPVASRTRCCGSQPKAKPQ
jgi:hypothetical protein